MGKPMPVGIGVEKLANDGRWSRACKKRACRSDDGRGDKQAGRN